jgi:hypothetical protein
LSDRAQEVAEELIGTCKDLRDVVEPHEIYDFEFCASLDDYAMRCETCGWWDDPEDMDTTGDEPECEECGGG